MDGSQPKIILLLHHENLMASNYHLSMVCSINPTAALNFFHPVASHLDTFRLLSFCKFHHTSSFSCCIITAKLVFMSRIFRKSNNRLSIIFHCRNILLSNVCILLITYTFYKYNSFYSLYCIISPYTVSLHQKTFCNTSKLCNL